MLPPGVKLENTYIPYQQGSKYTTPSIEEPKKPEQKKSKHKPVGFEEDDEDLAPKIPQKTPINTKSPPKQETSPSSGFTFIKQTPKIESPVTASSPPKKEEYF